jgi:subtilase-type serine protease
MSRTSITYRRRHSWRRPRFAGALLLGTCTACLGTAQAADELPQPATPILDYMTLDFEDNQTFLTGIRGDNIVGNFIIPNTSATGGLLYDSATGIWSPFPFATPDMTNYPGSTSSSPYGPSFGSYGGILRVVGSYKTDASPFDLGYLYDGAAAPGNELLTLAYPDPSTAFTIAHSTFGNLVVGNYDTGPLTGNAFIYDIAAGTYVTNNIPGEASTTAYGVWGDKIAGGYGGFAPDGEPGFEHGYIYDIRTDTFTTHNHPGAFFTHFEGITGAGRGGEYNLVVDWIGPNGLHAAVLHINALGHETWIPIEFPGAITTSANSIHQNRVIGVYTDADGVHGFEVTIPGIYNPIHNADTIVTDAPNTTVFEAGPGDDVVNDGSITTTGAFANAIRGDRHTVIYNNGDISVSGSGSGAAVLRGEYPSLLNAGTLKAAPAGDAVRADANSFGTLVVNTGIIDGRIDVRSGPQARFENSGLIGLSGAGAGVSSVISGIFAQTAAGIFAPRIQGDSNDTLSILGTARLDGVLAPVFQPGDFENSYTVLSASVERTGEFATLAASGLPGFLMPSIHYTDTQVIVNLEAELAQASGLTRNQRAVGARSTMRSIQAAGSPTASTARCSA